MFLASTQHPHRPQTPLWTTPGIRLGLFPCAPLCIHEPKTLALCGLHHDSPEQPGAPLTLAACAAPARSGPGGLREHSQLHVSASPARQLARATRLCTHAALLRVWRLSRACGPGMGCALLYPGGIDDSLQCLVQGQLSQLFGHYWLQHRLSTTQCCSRRNPGFCTCLCTLLHLPVALYALGTGQSAEIKYR